MSPIQEIHTGLIAGSVASAIAAGIAYATSKDLSRTKLFEIARANEFAQIAVRNGSEIDIFERDFQMIQNTTCGFIDILYQWLTKSNIANLSYTVLTDDFDAEGINPKETDDEVIKDRKRKLFQLICDKRFKARHVKGKGDMHVLTNYLQTRHFTVVHDPNQVWIEGDHSLEQKAPLFDVRLVKKAEKYNGFCTFCQTINLLKQNSVPLDLEARLQYKPL